MKSFLPLLTFMLVMQNCYAAAITYKTLPTEYQATATQYSQDSFPAMQKKSVVPSILYPIPLTGKSHLPNKYDRFNNPLYTFFNDSIVGRIGNNFVSRSRVFGFHGQRYLTEEGFDSIEEELTIMVEEGLRKKLLPYCMHFAKRPSMPLTGEEIFVLWITLQPQGASEEVMVTNNPFRIPPLLLDHKSYQEPFAVNRSTSRILQLENLYVGLMALEKYLQEQDQDLWPSERLIGTILSPQEHETYLENLKFFTRKLLVPERPAIRLVAKKSSSSGKRPMAY